MKSEKKFVKYLESFVIVVQNPNWEIMFPIYVNNTK